MEGARLFKFHRIKRTVVLERNYTTSPYSSNKGNKNSYFNIHLLPVNYLLILINIL